MNRLVGILGAAVLIALGHALECYKCDLGFWDMCITTKSTCHPGDQCFSGIGKAAHVIDLVMKGCLTSEDCNKVFTVDFFSNNTLYYVNKTCCATDLCNTTPSLSQEAPLSLLIVLATLWLVGALF